MKEDIKYVVIIGCGRLGAELAISLSKKHSVIVIDRNEGVFERLYKRNFTGFSLVIDTSDIDALKKIKLEKADIVYIVTPNDNLNFMLAYGVKKLNPEVHIIARVNDPLKKKLFEKAGLDLFCPIENSVNNLLTDFAGVEL